MCTRKAGYEYVTIKRAGGSLFEHEMRCWLGEHTSTTTAELAASHLLFAMMFGSMVCIKDTARYLQATKKEDGIYHLISKQGRNWNYLLPP